MSDIERRRQYTLACSLVRGIGPKTFREAYSAMGDSIEELSKENNQSSWGTKSSEVMNNMRNILDYEKILAIKSIEYICFWEANYPKNLTEIVDCPIVLFYIGEIEILNTLNLISIVGSRKATKSGIKTAHEIAYEFANLGWGVVSGLAAGVDSAAHLGTIEAGGHAVAVSPDAPHRPVPSVSSNIYDKVLQGKGLVLSEVFPGTKINKGFFVSRNRIIAGLSLGTLVVEAGEVSGSLITANHAFSYGREVFAIPGAPDNVSSKGCNYLIKKNKAKLTENISDILEEFNFSAVVQNKTANRNINLPKPLMEVYTLLTSGTVFLEDICLKIDRSSGDALSLLMQLELHGHIYRKDDGSYAAV